MRCAAAGDCDQYCSANVTHTDCFIHMDGPYGYELHPRTTICGCELKGPKNAACRSCNMTCRALNFGCAKGNPSNGTTPKSADGCYCYAYNAQMNCFPCT